jgi:hypothetical protein
LVDLGPHRGREVAWNWSLADTERRLDGKKGRNALQNHNCFQGVHMLLESGILESLQVFCVDRVVKSSFSTGHHDGFHMDQC